MKPTPRVDGARYSLRCTNGNDNNDHEGYDDNHNDDTEENRVGYRVGTYATSQTRMTRSYTNMLGQVFNHFSGKQNYEPGSETKQSQRQVREPYHKKPMRRKLEST